MVSMRSDWDESGNSVKSGLGEVLEVEDSGTGSGQGVEFLGVSGIALVFAIMYWWGLIRVRGGASAALLPP